MLSFNLEYYFLQLYKAETDFKWCFAFYKSWLLLRELLLVLRVRLSSYGSVIRVNHKLMQISIKYFQ